MSDESDHEMFNCTVRKRKKTARIEDSDSSSDDSPFEQHRKRKRVLVSDIFSYLSWASEFVVILTPV